MPTRAPEKCLSGAAFYGANPAVRATLCSGTLSVPTVLEPLLIAFVVWCAIFVGSGIGEACPPFQQFKFPQTPEPREFVQDYARLLSDQAIEKISKLQNESYDSHDTPIVVVTTESLSRFNAPWNQIEKTAHDLFNHWQIGKRDERNRLINKGILLLISVGERKARIELGADWGRRWDEHCDEIMQTAIVPHFKRGNYETGIRNGVERLASMARSEPDGEIPFSLGAALTAPMIPGFNSIPRWMGWLMMLAGFILIGLGFVFPDVQQPLVYTGIGLVLFAILFKAIMFLVFAILMFLTGGSDGANGGGWSGGGGGGFSSGGFSGGGGATGSW